MVSYWLSYFLLHPEHLRPNSENTNLSYYLSLVFTLIDYIHFLLKVEFRELLVDSKSKNVINGGQCFQIFREIVMWTSFPRVGVCVSEKRIHK